MSEMDQAPIHTCWLCSAFDLLLLPPHHDLFPLLVVGRGALGLGVLDLLGTLALGDLALALADLDLAFAGRGALEVLDAAAERVADPRELVGSEHDEHDQQDDDELPHSGHARNVASFRPGSERVPEKLVKPRREYYFR